jgi:hypothetical protein
MVVGWLGSTHDTWILNHALANFPSFPIPLKGKLIIVIFPSLSNALVDSNYPNQIGYLSPFNGSTYHLPKFHHRGRPPQGKHDIFNFFALVPPQCH